MFKLVKQSDEGFLPSSFMRFLYLWYQDKITIVTLTLVCLLLMWSQSQSNCLSLWLFYEVVWPFSNVCSLLCQINQALLPDGQRRFLCALHGPDGGGDEEAGGRHRSSQTGGSPGAGSEDEHGQHGPFQGWPEGGGRRVCLVWIVKCEQLAGLTFLACLHRST